MKLVIAGCAGRMGRTLMRLVHDAEDLTLHGGLEGPGSPHLGDDLGALAGLTAPLGIAATDNVLEALREADGVIDFSSPAATVDIAGIAAQARIVHVIGTTGFDAEQEQRLEAAARHAMLVKAGNMSLGVNLLMGLVEQAARALGPEWDIEILEMHHRHKVDAPSGTALMLGEAAAAGRGVSLSEVADRGRDGLTGAREEGAIGFAALRGGSVVGEHKVILAGPSERIEIGHIAEDRAIFARGALTAARWAFGREPGLYSMRDVLGLNA